MTETKLPAAYVDSPVPLIVCPCCKAPAEMFRSRHGTFMAECSDNIDCVDWPITKELSTAEEAAMAWNKGEVE